MSDLKKHQEPMNLEEQIQNLKNLGLIINDEEFAKSILNDISYFRLIKAYSLGFKEKNSSYNDNVTFEQIVDLYLFNAKFRHITFAEIERIEINVRCRISNYFSVEYGVLGYLDENNFHDQKFHKSFLSDIKEEIRRNSKAPFVKNFKTNYEPSELPLYAVVEILSFGTLSKLYKNMKNTDKKAISKSFGVGYTYLESWLESISYVRNICAHYSRLYNAKLVKTPILYDEYSKQGIKNNRVFGVLVCMKHLLSQNPDSWNQYVKTIDKLTKEYKNVNLRSMGFPNNWKKILLIKKLQ